MDRNTYSRRKGAPCLEAGGLAFLLFLLCHVPAPGASAYAGSAEADVKAAFVLNFIRFVEWPPTAFRSPDDPIQLLVAGKDPVGDAIEGLNGKTVSGRKVAVRKVPDLASLDRCHVLFVGASEKGEALQVLGPVQRWPILTIADFDGFAARGGTIGFIRKDDRVGFEINEESAKKAGLKINAKLLYLGKSVRGRQGGEK